MTATTEKIHLGKIEIEAQDNGAVVPSVYVNMLPTEYRAILVNLTTLQTSCILPSRKLEITYRTRPRNMYAPRRRRGDGSRRLPSREMLTKLQLDIPTLLFIGRTSQIPDRYAPRFVWSLFGLDETLPEQLKVSPYLMANVHARGEICFGALQPSNFRQAYNYFFSSAFNSDLSSYTRISDGGRRIHFCKKVEHDFSSHVGCLCEKRIEHSCCECSTAIFHNHHGCGCNTVVKSKKCKGRCNVNPNCACCFALNSNDASCRCTMRHKRTCKLIKETCTCACTCDCCTEKCDHTTCKCLCCESTCGCGCSCDQVELFQRYIENYGSKVLPHQSWQIKTDEICGTNFWSTSQKADGLLLTAHPDILKKVPKHFWKKSHLQNDKPFIICMGRNNGDEWQFESSKFDFTISSNQITFDRHAPK